MLDALVHGQDREVARAGQAAVREHLLQRAQHGHRPVRRREHAVHEVGTGQVEGLLGDALAAVLEEGARVAAQQVLDRLDAARLRHLRRTHGSSLSD